MSKVYTVGNDGTTQPMARIHCKNEDLELQRILEINPDLVPGDQINPTDPRRWLVVKREMPVPDPTTGDDRWSIDMFFVDQDAMPTFIECKRYNDSRAKREVVGQMLEYAANGHYYWSKEEMRNYAEESATKNKISLEEEIKRLQPEETESVDNFFQHVQDNLREGQVRLIFFMEEAPPELKSVVDFLNKQMERAEVLIVEARQYELNGTKVVTPILFGYTEEARQIKRTVSVNSGSRRKWDKESFFQDAKERLNKDQVSSIKQIFDKSQELKSEISWGTGKTAGSFSAKWSHLGKYSVFTIFSDGRLTVNFGSFNNDPEQRKFMAFLKEKLVTYLGFIVPEDYERRYPNYSVEQWAGKTKQFIETLDLIIHEYQPIDNV
ncbi:hypothetical protein [Desulfobacula sp.]|uniref:hypothetical protein n=1 Tax=Desulfobacula sp. TaxID=2593537 RepID=UPI002714A7B2|nr:hypothetical protein [Desulfobacula sp.]